MSGFSTPNPLQSPTLVSPTITGAWNVPGSQSIGPGGAGATPATFGLNGGSGVGGGAAVFYNNNGSVGAGTGTEAAILGSGTNTKLTLYSSTTTYRFYNLGAGTMTTDASGNVTISSDETLKNIHGPFLRGLADILKIEPITYSWNEISGLETDGEYSGLSAQNIRTAIPEAISLLADGTLGLQDRPIIAALVNSIKDLNTLILRMEAAGRSS